MTIGKPIPLVREAGMNPEWIAAGASAASALENGVTMLGKSKNRDSGATAPAPAAPAMVLRPVLAGWEIIAAAIILGLAMLGAAMIIHHGLTA